jgi:hypothetical protein
MTTRVRIIDPLDAWSKVQMALGALLILMAVAILLVPQILVAMVVAAIFMAGAGLLASGWRARRIARRVPQEGDVQVVEW